MVCRATTKVTDPLDDGESPPVRRRRSRKIHTRGRCFYETRTLKMRLAVGRLCRRLSISARWLWYFPEAGRLPAPLCLTLERRDGVLPIEFLARIARNRRPGA